MLRSRALGRIRSILAWLAGLPKARACACCGRPTTDPWITKLGPVCARCAYASGRAIAKDEVEALQKDLADTLE